MRLLQSLTRGLEALDYLHDKGDAARLTDVAEALGVEKSNASHILKTLVASGFAEQDTSRRYQTTGKFRRAASGQHSLEEIVACKEAWRPALEKLVAHTGECAHLAVLVETRVWYIDKIDSTLPLKVDHPIGSLSPLHSTALGKTFLAFGHAHPETKLAAYTPNTITTRAKLGHEIEAIRQQGYAVDNEEFAQGIRCVARPIFDGEGKMIAAVGISGPTVRIDNARLAELGRIVCSVSINQQEDAAE